MLEKMGWRSGKGLGKNEDGNPENIRVSYKKDNKGFGFDARDHDWIAHQDNFNTLLASLKKCYDSGQSQVEAKSQNLEDRAKGSRKRVHYHRFIRGKDLSRCTAQDLACLFPRESLMLSRSRNLGDICKTETVDKFGADQDHLSGPTLYTSQYNAQEYFSRKMQEKNLSEKQELASDNNKEVLSNKPLLHPSKKKRKLWHCAEKSSRETVPCQQEQCIKDSKCHLMLFDNETHLSSPFLEATQPTNSTETVLANNIESEHCAKNDVEFLMRKSGLYGNAAKISKKKPKPCDSKCNKYSNIHKRVFCDKDIGGNSATSSLSGVMESRNSRYKQKNAATENMATSNNLAHSSNANGMQKHTTNLNCGLGKGSQAVCNTMPKEAVSEIQDVPKCLTTGMQEILKECASNQSSWSKLKMKAVAYELLVKNINDNEVLRTSNLMEIKGYGNK